MSLVGDSVRPSCEHTFVKPELRAAARALRREEGLPLGAIAARLVSLSVNCYETNRMTAREIAGWWLSALGLPDSCARKPIVNRPSAASRRRRGNVLPYGTARLVVYSTFVVQSIYGAIQEYGRFDRPAWIN